MIVLAPFTWNAEGRAKCCFAKRVCLVKECSYVMLRKFPDLRGARPASPLLAGVALALCPMRDVPPYARRSAARSFLQPNESVAVVRYGCSQWTMLIFVSTIFRCRGVEPLAHALKQSN